MLDPNAPRPFGVTLLDDEEYWIDHRQASLEAGDPGDIRPSIFEAQEAVKRIGMVITQAPTGKLGGWLVETSEDRLEIERFATLRDIVNWAKDKTTVAQTLSKLEKQTSDG